MAVFTHLLDYPADLQRTPRLLEAKFGDGYIQTAGDGIQNDLEVWDLQASGIPISILNSIDQFLQAAIGNVFQWTSPLPGATQKNYICKSWKIKHDDEDEGSFSATFEQRITLV